MYANLTLKYGLKFHQNWKIWSISTHFKKLFLFWWIKLIKVLRQCCVNDYTSCKSTRLKKIQFCLVMQFYDSFHLSSICDVFLTVLEIYTRVSHSVPHKKHAPHFIVRWFKISINAGFFCTRFLTRFSMGLKIYWFLFDISSEFRDVLGICVEDSGTCCRHRSFFFVTIVNMRSVTRRALSIPATEKFSFQVRACFLVCILWIICVTLYAFASYTQILHICHRLFPSRLSFAHSTGMNIQYE